MRTPGWPKRRQTAIAASVVMLLVMGVLVAYAISAEGYPRHRADLNDGGVWVTGPASSPAFGRANLPIGQLDSTIPMSGTNLDILQDGSAVVGVQGSEVLAIDPSTASVPAGLRMSLPTNGQVALGGGTLATIDPASGRVRAERIDSAALPGEGPTTPIADLSGVDVTAPAAATLPGASRLAVTGNGAVLVFSASRHSLATITPTATGFSTPKIRSVSGTLTDATLVSAVGDTPVLLDPSAGLLQIPGQGTVSVPAGAMLQQASTGASPSVTFATPSGLYQESLTGGSPKQIAKGAGTPAAPVRIGSCVLGAWAGAIGTAVRVCDDGTVAPQQIGTSLQAPVFRVNRNEVVLNDTITGNAWNLERTPQLVTNWQDFNRVRSQTHKHSKSVNKGDNQHKPKATPDNLGARPGAITVLHVLDNDSSLTGKTLAIDGVTAVTGVSGAKITVAPDLQTIDFIAPPASTGKAQFRYSIDDGGPSVSTNVTVTMRSGGEPAQPQLRPKYVEPTYHVPSNGSIEVPVIADWRDYHTGDALSLKGASARSGTAAVTPAGRIRFTAPTAGGMQTVDYTVEGSVGGPVAGHLRFDVEGPNDTQAFAATAEPDVVTATVGKAVTFNPLANDLPGSDPVTPDATTTIAGNPTGGNGSVSTDPSSGRVTFTPTASGTQWLTYQAAYGTAPVAKGSIRVNVSKAASDKPIAVPDQTALYGGQSALVDVLANDVDPRGGMLTVTRAQPERSGPDQQLAVSVVRGRWLRIQSRVPEPSPHAQTVSYWITNGQSQAEGQVAVVWHPPNNSAQPVTTPDQAVVRAGSTVVVPVLNNDFSPTGSQLSLVTDGTGSAHAGTLPMTPALGEAYTTTTDVVYTAPRSLATPTTVTVDYVAQDQAGNHSASTPVRIQVIPPPSKAQPDRPPTPPTLEARVISGDTVTVKLPDGSLDPDGDPVTLSGVTSAPRLGRLVRMTANSFDYEAFPGQSGTDTFGYQLSDQYGESASGSVRIAVSTPVQPQPPLALPDSITVAPGRQVTVDVLANDIVSPGDQPTLRVVDGPKGARFIGNSGLLVTPGPTDDKTPVRVTYAISDGLGQPSQAVVTIQPQGGFNNPPVAFDVYGDASSKAPETTADVMAKAYDPDGPSGDLKIAVQPPAGVSARVVGSDIVVTRTQHEQVVPFTLTDPEGGVGSAVVYVPAIKSGAPYVDPTRMIRVAPGKTTNISLSDVVIDPAGRAVHLGLASQIVGSPEGSVSVSSKSDSSLSVSASAGYRGPGAIGFPVYDGSKIDDPKGQQAYLVVPVLVGNEQALLSCPQDPVIVREGGDPVSLDIGSLCHVWTSTLGARSSLRFSATWAQQVNNVAVSGPGSQITLTPGSNARAGDTGMLQVRIVGSTSPGARLSVAVQASPRPTVPDITREFRSNSAHTVDIAPFVSREIRNPKIQVTGITHMDPGVTAHASGSTIDLAIGKTHGVKALEYSFTDAPGNPSPSRQGQGRIILTVQDAPDRPAAPQGASGQSQHVLLSWPAPADNGAPIQYYDVRWNGGTQRCAATHCLINGLANGSSYSFTVRAHNAVGDSQWSASSAPVTPDAKPGPVSGIHVVAIGSGTLGLAWSPPSNQTSRIKNYTVRCSPGCGGATSPGPRATVRGLNNDFRYTFTIFATNQRFVGQTATSAAFQSAGTPQTVTGLQASFDQLGGGNPVVRLSWGSADPNGPSPVSYAVTEDGSPVCGSTRGTSCSIPSSWGARHTYRVQALTTDSLGRVHHGAWGELRNQDISGTPDPPTGINLDTPQPDSRLHLSWSATNGRGAAPHVECQVVGGGGCGSSLPQSGSTTIAGLNNGQDYSVQLRQCNASSKCSSWVTAGPAKPYGMLSNGSIINASANVSGTTVDWTIAYNSNGRPATLTVTSDKGRNWSQSVDSGPGNQSVDIGAKDIGYSSSESITVTISDSGRGSGSRGFGPSAQTAGPPVTVRVSKGPNAVATSGSGPCTTSSGCPQVRTTTANFQGPVSCTITDSSIGTGGFVSWTQGPNATRDGPNVQQSGYVTVECHDGAGNQASGTGNW